MATFFITPDLDLAVAKTRFVSDFVIDWTATPPTSPDVGDAYIIASGGTGAWAGWTHYQATWNGASWDFVGHPALFLVYVEEQNQVIQRIGGWVVYSPGILPSADMDVHVKGVGEPRNVYLQLVC